jgi:hypothetical protein
VSQTLASFVYDNYKASGQHSFDVEITETRPTSQQTNSILSYLATARQTPSPAESPDSDLPKELTSLGVSRPILVDWFNGKVSINDEKGAKQLLADLAKQSEES